MHFLSNSRDNRPLVVVVRSAMWIGLSLITLFPIYWLVVISARSRVELFSEPQLLQTTFYAQNYIRPLIDDIYGGFIVNSVIIAGGNTILVLICAIMAAYALSRFRVVGSENLFFWFITNRMAPPAAFMLPLFLLFTRVFAVGDFKLFDTMIGIIFVYCVFNLPFAIWIMKGTLDNIPKDVDEAARLDGLNSLQILLRMIIPLSAPTIGIVALLNWLFAWNEYLFAATLTSFSARTITTGLAEFVTVTGTEWGEMAAVTVVCLAPSILFLILVQRYIVTGLTFGAVK